MCPVCHTVLLRNCQILSVRNREGYELLERSSETRHQLAEDEDGSRHQLAEDSSETRHQLAEDGSRHQPAEGGGLDGQR